jgi:hypothetical protein
VIGSHALRASPIAPSEEQTDLHALIRSNHISLQRREAHDAQGGICPTIARNRVRLIVQHSVTPDSEEMSLSGHVVRHLYRSISIGANQSSPALSATDHANFYPLLMNLDPSVRLTLQPDIER